MRRRGDVWACQSAPTLPAGASQERHLSGTQRTHRRHRKLADRPEFQSAPARLARGVAPSAAAPAASSPVLPRGCRRSVGRRRRFLCRKQPAGSMGKGAGRIRDQADALPNRGRLHTPGWTGAQGCLATGHRHGEVATRDRGGDKEDQRSFNSDPAAPQHAMARSGSHCRCLLDRAQGRHLARQAAVR